MNAIVIRAAYLSLLSCLLRQTTIALFSLHYVLQ